LDLEQKGKKPAHYNAYHDSPPRRTASPGLVPAYQLLLGWKGVCPEPEPSYPEPENTQATGAELSRNNRLEEERSGILS